MLVFARVRRDADRARVTALIEKVSLHSDAFRGIPRRSSYPRAPKPVAGAPRMATKWQPLGRLGKSKDDWGCLGQVSSPNGWGLSVEKDRAFSILVRGLDPRTVQLLKARARINGRSLQQEIKEILQRPAGMITMREARWLSERWRHRLSQKSFSDSAQLIREDRDSR